jgi:hypothetical protein
MNCLWWDEKHVSVKRIPKLDWKPNPGFCRKHKPGAIMVEKSHVGIQPVMDAEEFCGEWREDK